MCVVLLSFLFPCKCFYFITHKTINNTLLFHVCSGRSCSFQTPFTSDALELQLLLMSWCWFLMALSCPVLWRIVLGWMSGVPPEVTLTGQSTARHWLTSMCILGKVGSGWESTVIPLASRWHQCHWFNSFNPFSRAPLGIWLRWDSNPNHNPALFLYSFPCFAFTSRPARQRANF